MVLSREAAELGLVGLSRVDVYDVRARTWVDVNPMDEIAGGFQLESPIVGLSSTPNRVLLQERNDVGNRVIGKAVAATMYNGAVVLLEADSGCAALDFEGPHVPQNQGFESIVFSDVGNASNPDMVADEPPAMDMPPPCSGYTAHACMGVRWLRLRRGEFVPPATTHSHSHTPARPTSNQTKPN